MEFTAVIVCGKGKALTPFSQARSTGIPETIIANCKQTYGSICVGLVFTSQFFKNNRSFEKEDEFSGVLEQTIKRYQEEKRRPTPMNLTLVLMLYLTIVKTMD